MHPEMYMTIYRDKERELQQRLRYRLAAEERARVSVRPDGHRRRALSRMLNGRLNGWLKRGSQAVRDCCAPAACCVSA